MGIMIPIFMVLTVVGLVFFGFFLLIIYGSLYIEKWFWDAWKSAKAWFLHNKPKEPSAPESNPDALNKTP